MSRTTYAAVALIIEVDSNVSTDLAPFIEVASSIVEEVCNVTDADGDAVHTDATLELIERWLTAHFYAIRDPRTILERAGKVSASFQSKVDLGFDTSHYGQAAMRLDTNGGLSQLNQMAKDGNLRTVGMAWLGTDYTINSDS